MTDRELLQEALEASAGHLRAVQQLATQRSARLRRAAVSGAKVTRAELADAQ